MKKRLNYLRYSIFIEDLWHPAVHWGPACRHIGLSPWIAFLNCL